MASIAEKYKQRLPEEEEDEEIDEEEVEGWDDWNADEESDDDNEFKCLFCDLKYNSTASLFDHCVLIHRFDFYAIKKSLELDFYGCFKIINYVRLMVSEKRCWSCGQHCESIQVLQSHLHAPNISKDLKLMWNDDKFLQPFLQGDSLLYSFDEDDDGEDDECLASVDRDEVMRDLGVAANISVDDDAIDAFASASNGGIEPSTSNGSSKIESLPNKAVASGASMGRLGSSDIKKDKSLRASLTNVAASEIKKVNQNYFGSYSSFGIHREMLSDKVRMDAYRQAILDNPSLLNGAVVMDVGCGTGILSLFAAQAGASRVVAVEGSEKMASVATQIAKDNGHLWSENPCNDSESAGAIKMVNGMVEELDLSSQIEPHGIDVLLSEWMGYCLLYESMLSSVLYARDRWLKPGGAILPDTATMFAAGFGRGGTSLPFWEDVYGFNMSCVGKELVEDASKFPIVDVVDSRDIVTETAVLQYFDLVTMKIQDMDFTSSIELQPKASLCQHKCNGFNPEPTWCHGLVLWFETGFTTRFCKETPANLSTSPYTPKTHWAQTIFTFKEPVALSLEKPKVEVKAPVGTDACPAMRIQSRISVARASEHRAIDISIEITGVSHDGRNRSWPVQILNLS